MGIIKRLFTTKAISVYIHCDIPSVPGFWTCPRTGEIFNPSMSIVGWTLLISSCFECFAVLSLYSCPQTITVSIPFFSRGQKRLRASCFLQCCLQKLVNCSLIGWILPILTAALTGVVPGSTDGSIADFLDLPAL